MISEPIAEGDDADAGWDKVPAESYQHEGAASSGTTVKDSGDANPPSAEVTAVSPDPIAEATPEIPAAESPEPRMI